MTAPEKAHKLVERYVQEVCRHLPGKLRSDVQEELRSLLKESLEGRVISQNRALNEELAVEVLREFGEPEKVAERYLPNPGYLISPRMFPSFLFIAKIVLAANVGWFVLWYVLSLSMSESTLARLPQEFQSAGVVELLGAILKNALINLGLLVLVFAVLERVVRSGQEKSADWDPLQLPALKDPDRLSPAHLAFKLYAILLLFALLNFAPQWFGLVFFTGDSVRAIPFYDLGLKIPVLLMNLWWAGAFALNVVLLRLGGWTRETRWAEFGLGLFGSVILYVTLAGGSLPGVEMHGLWDSPVQLLKQARAGLPWVARIIHWVLTFLLVAMLIEAVVRLARILRRYPA